MKGRKIKAKLEKRVNKSECTVRHPFELVMQRRRFVGPVIRISRTDDGGRHTYHIVNRSTTAAATNRIEADRGKKRSRSVRREFPIDGRAPDSSWTCALCHRGPNVSTLGFLYGPYRLADIDSGVWFHEDCLVWSTGVWLNGSNQLTGLRTMLDEAMRSTCNLCGRVGATMGCFVKSCKQFAAVHYPCIRDDTYNHVILEHNCTIYCHRHSQMASIRNCQIDEECAPSIHPQFDFFAQTDSHKKWQLMCLDCSAIHA